MGGFGAIEEQVRRNMEMFERTFSMFAPFARQGRRAQTRPPTGQAGQRSQAAAGGGDIDDLKRQIEEMQKRIDRIGDKRQVVAHLTSHQLRNKWGRALGPSPEFVPPEETDGRGRHALLGFSRLRPPIRHGRAAARRSASCRRTSPASALRTLAVLVRLGHRTLHVADARHRLAADIEDHIAGLHAVLGGGAVGIDAGDDHALAAGTGDAVAGASVEPEMRDVVAGLSSGVGVGLGLLAASGICRASAPWSSARRCARH